MRRRCEVDVGEITGFETMSDFLTPSSELYLHCIPPTDYYGLDFVLHCEDCYKCGQTYADPEQVVRLNTEQCR